MPGRKRHSPEAALHRAVAAYLRVALPEDAVWTTFPAGGGGRVRGAQLKAAGLMAGWPDIQILHHGKLICVELKAARGRLSDTQAATILRIQAAGGLTVLAYSVADVETMLRAYGVPLRASITARAA